MDNLNKNKLEKNLILTAAFGFNIQQLELFIRSLRKYYTGDVCFIIGFNDKDIEQELKKYNCICIKKKLIKEIFSPKGMKFF